MKSLNCCTFVKLQISDFPTDVDNSFTYVLILSILIPSTYIPLAIHIPIYNLIMYLFSYCQPLILANFSSANFSKAPASGDHFILFFWLLTFMNCDMTG